MAEVVEDDHSGVAIKEETGSNEDDCTVQDKNELSLLTREDPSTVYVKEDDVKVELTEVEGIENKLKGRV